MSRDEYEDTGSPAANSPGAAEHDAITEALTDEPEFAPVFEALVATLAEEELPAGGWEALQGRLSATSGAGAAQSAATRMGATSPTGATSPSDATSPTDAAGQDTRRGSAIRRSEAPAEPAHRPSTTGKKAASRGGDNVAARWLVAAVLAAAVVVAGSWGSLKAGEAADLRDDQRILAYWMANPEMRLIALSAPAGQSSDGRPRLGVVCILPDGRGLLLQPSAAPRGATFVVTGDGPDGSRVLARGRGNMLQFDAGGVSSVEVALVRRNEIVEPIAVAVLD